MIQLQSNWKFQLEENDSLFIEQVFYGILQYKKMIKVCILLFKSHVTNWRCYWTNSTRGTLEKLYLKTICCIQCCLIWYSFDWMNSPLNNLKCWYWARYFYLDLSGWINANKGSSENACLSLIHVWYVSVWRIHQRAMGNSLWLWIYWGNSVVKCGIDFCWECIVKPTEKISTWSTTSSWKTTNKDWRNTSNACWRKATYRYLLSSICLETDRT